MTLIRDLIPKLTTLQAKYQNNLATIRREDGLIRHVSVLSVSILPTYRFSVVCYDATMESIYFLEEDDIIA